MAYVKNADLTRKSLYRLIRRSNCKDITDSVKGAYALVVETDDIDIVGFDSLVKARRWLEKEAKRVSQERKQAWYELMNPAPRPVLGISQDEATSLNSFYSGIEA